MISIRTHHHQLFCETVQKTGLSAFNDKRYLINAIESYAYGHYKIKDHKTCNPTLLPHTNIPSVEMMKDTCFMPVEIMEDQSFMLNGFKVTPCK